ncbi:TPA: hypothetical protein RQO38_001170 [Klebsiella michiganensis]|nr:hypothetical protein [Klebsiella michiganensis]HDX8885376.1 hypothetical protein [Klebsiella michiganensis]
MTITLQAVNELIQSLESAGELSIKETKVMALAKAFKQLAAENVALKAGASYFSYGSEHNFEWHKTAKEAVEAAEAAIDDYRGDACDGWSEEVDSICWGIIMQSSTKVGERPRDKDDHCDPAIDTVCDYALLPNIETPATDRIVAGIKADGVEMFALMFAEEAIKDNNITTGWKARASRAASEYAELLREGADK